MSNCWLCEGKTEGQTRLLLPQGTALSRLSPQLGVPKTLTLPFGSAKRRFPEDGTMISTGFGCHFDLLFIFKGPQMGSPTSTGCQEGTQALGLRTEWSVGERG